MQEPIPLRAGFERPISAPELHIEIHAALAAVREVVAPTGPWPAGARRLADAVLWKAGMSIDPASIDPAPLASTARTITDAARRVQLVRLAIVAAMIDGRPSVALAERVHVLARGLGVDTPELADLRLLAAGKTIRMRRHLLLRFWPRKIAVAHARVHGWWTLVRMFLVWLGLATDPAIRDRFAALADLPSGTLGHTLIAFWRGAGIGLPGERGAPPFIVFYHDLSHVLAGYATDARSEVQAGCFQGGYLGGDGFSLVFFVLCQFHLGVRVTPIAPAEIGMFDPYRALDAVCRGAGMTRDLVDGTWDVWAAMGEPVEELRNRYHVVPPAVPESPRQAA